MDNINKCPITLQFKTFVWLLLGVWHPSPPFCSPFSPFEHHLWDMVLIFCVEFWKLTHLTRDFSQAEKKITVVTSWATDKIHSKWLKLTFWVKIVVIFSVAHLVTTFISFSAGDKSRVKWSKSRNSTQKMRT